MSLIIDTVQSYLPAKRKVTPSGWVSFNAVCCHHNGTSADNRQRGGIMVNEGVSYHCFNCGFKCSWQPGRHISQKLNQFMRNLNIPDDVIGQLRLEALRLDSSSTVEVRNIIPEFDVRALPMDSEPLSSLIDNPPEKLIPVLEYMVSRKLFPEDYAFHWTPKVGFSNRLIIPFLYKGNIVGWTARAINDAKPKYLSEQQPGYVFNLDSQQDDRQLVIVCEGPFDALSIDGCAILGAEIKDSQNWLLKQLGKEII